MKLLRRCTTWLQQLPISDPLEYRKAQMVQTMLLGLIGMCLLAIPLILEEKPLWKEPPIGILTDLIIIGLLLIGLRLVRRGQTQAAIILTVGAIHGALLILLIFWGLRESFDISMALVLPIVLAGLFLDRRGTLIVMGITLFTIATVVYADSVLGIYPPTDPNRPIFVRAAAMALIATAITFVLDRLRIIYQHNLHDLATTNQQLQNELIERERTRQELLDSEERFRLITEKSSEIIALIDVSGVYVYISPAMHRTLGFEPQTMLGQSPTAYAHPEDVEMIIAAWDRVRNNQDAHIIFRHRHADGGWRTLESTGVPVQYRNVEHYVIIAHDITRRLEMEHSLVQSQKMEAIGRLAGGVAHDFNNLLVAINGYVELAGLHLPAEHPAQNDLREVRKATERARNLTRQLLTFAHRHPSDTRLSNLNTLINDMATILQRLVREDIELQFRLAPQLWPAMIDPVQFEQVIVNLVVNARDAMPEGGDLIIQTQNITLSHETLWKTTRLTDGQYVVVTVRDTGIGMDADTRQHIFEPFFTTKSSGSGTGLGLSTCYGIVARHGGDILVASEPGQGAALSVYLPRAEGLPLQTEDTGLSTPELPSGHETVLLVEDEAVVRSLAMRVLQTHGYTVREALDGEHALHLLRTQPEPPISLILSDVVMPRMGGVALARRIVEEYPHIHILLMSGYSEQPLNLHNADGHAIEVLQKPFTVQELVHKVRSILDDRGGDRAG